jgi:hypothetical protein
MVFIWLEWKDFIWGTLFGVSLIPLWWLTEKMCCIKKNDNKHKD